MNFTISGEHPRPRLFSVASILAGKTGRVFIPFALTALLIPILCARPAPAFAKNLESAHLAVWQIYDEKYHSVGTAFAIRPNEFITAAHLIKGFVDNDSERIRLRREGDKTFLRMKRVLLLSTTYDLALIRTKQAVEHYLTIARHFSKEEGNLRIIARPRGDFQTARQVEEITYEDGFSYLIPMNRNIIDGYSGSPVLNSEGDVVAVLQSSSHNMASGVRLGLLQQFVAMAIGVECFDLSFMGACLHRAMNRTQTMAQRGNPIARHQIGDPDSAFFMSKRWLVQSAEQGFIPARMILGKTAEEKKEWKKAVDWFEPAIAKNHLASLYGLAWVHYKTKDFDSAFRLALQSARGGYAPSQYMTGYMYYKGQGTRADRKSAVHWLQKAADRGGEKAWILLESIKERR